MVDRAEIDGTRSVALRDDEAVHFKTCPLEPTECPRCKERVRQLAARSVEDTAQAVKQAERFTAIMEQQQRGATARFEAEKMLGLPIKVVGAEKTLGLPLKIAESRPAEQAPDAEAVVSKLRLDDDDLALRLEKGEVKLTLIEARRVFHLDDREETCLRQQLKGPADLAKRRADGKFAGKREYPTGELRSRVASIRRNARNAR